MIQNDCELSTLPYLSIIMPAYNDAEALQVFLPQVFAFTKTLILPSSSIPEARLVTSSSNIDSSTLLKDKKSARCEIIIVDDGSSDHLIDIVTTLMPICPDNTQLHLVRLSRNFGKEPALSAGLAQAQGDVVAMIDADGQHP